MERMRLEAVGARYLKPESAKIFRGRLGSLHCVVDDKEAYANVYCKLCMPVRHPTHYVSVWHTNDENKEKQIGIIEDLETFPQEMRDLVRGSLSHAYFERVILRVIDVKWQFGLLFFQVEIQEGPAEFMMRWQHDRALEYGDNGKVLLDVYENRYVIPNMDTLPAGDRDRLMRFIYW
jgi:ATP-binding cassette, subfamily B, bacterial